MSSDWEKIKELAMTKKEWERWIRELELLEKACYRIGDAGWEEVVKTQVGEDVAEIILDQNISNDNIKIVLRKLIDELKNRKTLRIILPVKPSKEITEKIKRWMEKNSNPGIVIEISIDEDLIAGAEIVYEGKIFNGSLKAKWDKLWEENQEKWLKLTRRI